MRTGKWLVALAASIAAVVAQAEPKPVINTGIVLEAFEFKGLDSVKLAKGAQIGAFTSFHVAKPELSFQEHWHRQHRFDLSDHDVQRLREDYTRMLKEELEKSIAKNSGLKLVDTPSADTLVIVPHLNEFRLVAPDLKGPLTRHFVDHVGAAELELRLASGVDGTVLAELTDQRQTRSFGVINDLKRTNRGINKRDFRELFRLWGSRTGQFLSEAQSQV